MSIINKYVFAIGGGGFTHGKDRSLENFILSIKNKEILKIGFLPTASQDNYEKTKLFYERFKKTTHKLSHFELLKGTIGFQEWVLSNDIIYVGGGNTNFMLELWKKNNLKNIFIEAYANGIILSGVSAGAVCWFKNILSNSLKKNFTHLKGIGLINLSCTPHASSEPERVKVLQQKVRNGIMPPGIAIDDGVGVLLINGKIKKVFTARKNHSAYYIDQTCIKNLEQKNNSNYQLNTNN